MVNGQNAKKSSKHMTEREFFRSHHNRTKSESVKSHAKEIAALPTKCCAVPRPLDKKICQIGASIDPENVPDGAELFLCSNGERCSVNKWVHGECIELLEEHLLKLMERGDSRCAANKSWTDAQRRRNIWNKKGYETIYKYCRCACGGYMEREVDGTVAVAVKQAPKAPSAAKVNAKLKKDSLLPKLASANLILSTNAFSAACTNRLDLAAVQQRKSYARNTHLEYEEESEEDAENEYSYYNNYSSPPSSNTFSSYVDPSNLHNARGPRFRNKAAAVGPSHTHFWNEQPVKREDTNGSASFGRRKVSSNYGDSLNDSFTDPDQIRDEDTLREKVRSLLAASDGRLMWDDASLLRIDVLLHGALKRTVCKMGGIRDWLFQHCPPHWCSDYFPCSPSPTPQENVDQEDQVSETGTAETGPQRLGGDGDQARTGANSVCSATSTNGHSLLNTSIITEQKGAVQTSSTIGMAVSGSVSRELDCMGLRQGHGEGRTDSRGSASGRSSSLMHTPNSRMSVVDGTECKSPPYISANNTHSFSESPPPRPSESTTTRTSDTSLLALELAQATSLLTGAHYYAEPEHLMGWTHHSLYRQHTLQLREYLERLRAML